MIKIIYWFSIKWTTLFFINQNAQLVINIYCSSEFISASHHKLSPRGDHRCVFFLVFHILIYRIILYYPSEPVEESFHFLIIYRYVMLNSFQHRITNNLFFKTLFKYISSLRCNFSRVLARKYPALNLLEIANHPCLNIPCCKNNFVFVILSSSKNLLIYYNV